jgi:2-aminoethylphosphonate-pyruvate transaminase
MELSRAALKTGKLRRHAVFPLLPVCTIHFSVDHVVPLAVPPKSRINSNDITSTFNADPQISHVAFVYSETGTGIVHNAPEISAAARLAGRRVIVDAVSAFGAFPLDIKNHPEIDAVIFTPNKCLESVSGVSFAVARQDRLTESRQNAKSFCMDLSDVHAKRWGL